MTQTTDTPLVPAANDGSEQLVGRYREYVEAQHAVDALSDAGFPVGSVRIVGRDVTIVEQVTGRLTKARATGLGAASGAWFGLFIGLLMGLFAVGGFFTLLLVGLVIGAFWGAVFGFFGHLATGGQRDFSSVRGLAAGSYDVVTDAGLGDRARAVLAGPTAA
ncbi:general stress protein [Quadrisphaera oryzae]|uniref:general stress protein n=1 Tax=Quadrisphaera TaxID=317661 RepID=UPI0016485C1A|nr:general stress protein [Quadrisphaera sp. RL12-1S]MBC3763319.1 hypothetical protein [Quadrisphaera sp. RL12-1S]